LDDGVDVLLADAMEPVRVQKSAIGRDSDDRLAHVHLLIILNGPRYGGLFDGSHCLTKKGGSAPQDPKAKAHPVRPQGAFSPHLCCIAGTLPGVRAAGYPASRPFPARDTRS